MDSLFLLIEKRSSVFDLTTNYTTLFDMPKEGQLAGSVTTT